MPTVHESSFETANFRLIYQLTLFLFREKIAHHIRRGKKCGWFHEEIFFAAILSLTLYTVLAEEIEVVDERTTTTSKTWGTSMTIDARTSPVPITQGKNFTRTMSASISGALSSELLGVSFEVEFGTSTTETTYFEVTAPVGVRVTVRYGSIKRTVTLTRTTYKRRADGSLYVSSRLIGTARGTTGSITQGL